MGLLDYYRSGLSGRSVMVGAEESRRGPPSDWSAEKISKMRSDAYEAASRKLGESAARYLGIALWTPGSMDAKGRDQSPVFFETEDFDRITAWYGGIAGQEWLEYAAYYDNPNKIPGGAEMQEEYSGPKYAGEISVPPPAPEPEPDTAIAETERRGSFPFVAVGLAAVGGGIIVYLASKKGKS